MTRSIELLLDEQIEAAVRADWDALADAGLPSLAAHRSPTNRPHVTLAAGDGILPVAPVGLPLDVTFAGLVTFSAGRDRFVLARLVVLSTALASLQAEVHAGLAALGADVAAAAVPNSRPGGWTPHVTLARRMTAEQVGAAHALLGVQGPGRLVAARFWDSATGTVSVL